jgi:hypothetical protein
MLIHFASQFGALRRGILQIWKKFRFLRTLVSWHLFQIGNILLLSAPNRHAMCLDIFTGWALWGSVCECLDETGRVILHASSDPLEVENCKSFKKSDFSDLQFKCSEVARKVSKHFRPGVVRICVYLNEAFRFTLQASSEHLDVEYCKSEKTARIWRFSGIWWFFRICNVPLLSAPN